MASVNNICAVCDKPTKPSNSIQCNLCISFVHLKCNFLIPSDCKALTKEWFCTSCNANIFPFNCSYKASTESKPLFNHLNALNINVSENDDDVAPVTDCKYYEPTEFRDLQSKSKSFSTMHLNIASLSRHFDELGCLLAQLDHEFSIIGITETRFLKSVDPVINFSLSNYSYVHTPTESSAGGALMYISNRYSFIKRNDLSNSLYASKDLESVFVEIIQKKKKNIIVGTIYRHPGMPLDNFNERYLSPLLDKISKENKTAVLLGDFNVDLLKCESNSNAADFLDVLGAHSFVPQILYPTRITKTSKTLIDNIFVNFLDKEICSGNLTSSISDHLPQFMFFSYEHNNVTKGKKFL